MCCQAGACVPVFIGAVMQGAVVPHTQCIWLAAALVSMVPYCRFCHRAALLQHETPSRLQDEHTGSAGLHKYYGMIPGLLCP